MQLMNHIQDLSNVLNVDKNSRIFLIQEIADEKYEIRFGDDIVGKKPANGSRITVSYIVTNGSLGNGASNFTLSGLFRDNNGLILPLVFHHQLL
jgi:hypothetical protein